MHAHHTATLSNGARPSNVHQGYFRLRDILGDPDAVPPVPPFLPISKSSWWAGVKSGRYPASVKLGPNTTAWRIADILKLAETLDMREAA